MFGFIGFNFVNHLLVNFKNEFSIIGIDNLNNNWSSENKKLLENVNFEHIDLDINEINNIEINDIDILINFAAESHVDNSIAYPKTFLETNTLGTLSLLNFAKTNNIKNLYIYLQMKFMEVRTIVFLMSQIISILLLHTLHQKLQQNTSVIHLEIHMTKMLQY